MTGTECNELLEVGNKRDAGDNGSAHAVPGLGGVVSLWNMIRFLASSWDLIIRDLESLSDPDNPDVAEAFVSGNKAQLIRRLKLIESCCQHLGLKYSADYATEIVAVVDKSATLALAPGAPKPLQEGPCDGPSGRSIATTGRR